MSYACHFVRPLNLLPYRCAEELVDQLVHSNSVVGLGTGVMVSLCCANIQFSLMLMLQIRRFSCEIYSAEVHMFTC